MKQLSGKRQRFVDEYLILNNGSEAVRRAGYTCSNPDRQAFVLLRNAEVQKAIEQKRLELQKKTDITRDMILAELAAVAFSDVREFFDEYGNFKNFEELPDSAAKSMSSLEVQALYAGTTEIGITKKFKRWDKIKALELISRILGYIENNNKGADTNNAFLELLKRVSAAKKVA